MSHRSELIATDINAYLAQHERKQLLRFLTCGSVDDGKSTMIGRLFYDAKLIYEDTLRALERDSAIHGTTGGGFDPALFTDGLRAEREQGITIDVAYRYFSTANRKFIIADTPGHEQYTRNMATGASTCDLAVILVDARNGVVTQTKRHSFIVSLLGIKHVLVAVNKMDLVGFRREVFDQIRADYIDFAARLDIPDLHFLPISALKGDNVVDPSPNMPWYQGSTLMHFLDNVYIGSDRNLEDFRFPVQLVNRPHLDFRGFCGTIASGIIRRGDEIMVLPSRKTSRVKSIVTFDGDQDEAFAPQAVTLTLTDEIDISRGDMIVRPGNMPKLEQRFDAMVVWMSEQPMVPGKQYLFKQTTKQVSGTIDTMRYQVDVNTLHRRDAPTLGLNEIGRCAITLAEPIAFDDYRRNRGTGSLIVIDRLTNVTVGAGMIMARVTADRRHDHWDDEPASVRLHSETSQVKPDERQARFGQRPATILLTGLTGSGKTTLAYAVERRLFDMGRVSTVLDGQNLRLGISRDLGFSSEDRSENMRRGAEFAKLINDAGLICLAAFVAPSEEVRQRAAEVIGRDRFLVVHLAAPIEVCRQRAEGNPYAQAEAGEIANFPGVSFPYDTPASPDLTLPTHEMSVDDCVDQIMTLLSARAIVR
ncbi:MAG: sulfate adenylyltransferase subunit CysN [Pirellulaceae bacterium]|nr:sulfate adenylyltransferase subunit CysN [Pirellulaceae bacterium]